MNTSRSVKKINDLILALPQSSMQLETDISGSVSNKITLNSLKNYFSSNTLLQDLKNISVTNLSDNDYLVYDAANAEFINQQLPAIPQEISDLEDVLLTNISNNDFLVWSNSDSAFVNQQVSIPTNLDDLTDVTLVSLNDNDILIYDSNTQTFTNAQLFIPEELNDLTDVDITSATANQVLTFDGASWVNDDITFSISFGALSDVNFTNLTADDIAVFNGTDWVNEQKAFIPEDLNDLTDVTINTPLDEQVLRYNAGQWQNETLNLTTSFADLDDVSFTGLANNDIAVFNGTLWVNQPLDTGVSQLGELDDVSLSFLSNQQALVYFNGEWINQFYNFVDLTGIDISSPATDEVLSYNGTSWVNKALTTADISNIDDSAVSDGQILSYESSSSTYTPQDNTLNNLTDTSISTPTSAQFLRYNGTNWVNETVSLTTSFAGLTDTDFGAFFPLTTGDLVTYGAAGEWVNAPVDQIISVPEVLNDLDDVNITSLTAGQVLLSDGFSEFNNTDLVTTTLTNVSDGGVTDDQVLAYNAGNSAYENVTLDLNFLDDVNIGSPSDNDFMLYNSTTSNFESVQFDIDNIKGVSVGSVIEGQVLRYTSGGVLENSFLDLDDLDNVELSPPSNEDVIIYDTGSYRNIPISSFIPNVPENLGDLDNVNITTPSNDQVLTYDTGLWLNKDLPPIPTELNDLDDVGLTSPSGGELFVYSGANSRWQNGFIGINQLSNVTITSPLLNQVIKLTNTSPQTFTNTFVDIDELSGVDITSPANGDVLIYNDASSNFENSTLQPKKDEWALYGFGGVNKGNEVTSTPTGAFYNPALNRIVAQDIDDVNNFPMFLNPSPSLNGDQAGSNGGGYYVEVQTDGYYDLTGYVAVNRTGGVGDFGAVFLQFVVTNELGDVLFFETSGLDFDRVCNSRLYTNNLYLKAGYRVRFLIRYVSTDEFWRYGQIDIMSSNSNTFINAKDMALQNDETTYGTSFKVTKRNSIKSEGGKLPATMDTLISIGANNSGSLNNDFAVAGFGDTVQYVEQWSYTDYIRDVYRMNTGGGSISANYMMYIDNDMRIYSSGRYDDGANGQNGASSDTFVDITSPNNLKKPFRVLPKVRDGMFNNIAIGEFCSFLLVRDNNNSIAVCGLRANGRLLGINDGANVDTFTRYSGSGVSNALTISCSRRAQVWIKGTRSGQTGLPYAAGSNEFGATGNGSTSGTKNPGTIGFFLQSVWGVASGLNFSVYLLTGGTMRGFGQDANGQLAQGGTSIARSDPVTLTDTTTNSVSDAIFLACGSQHTMVIREDFTLWACGRGVLGATGLGTTANATRLTDTGLTQIQRVFCGANCSAAIDFEGKLYFTGANNGEVAIGSVAAGTVTYDFVEVELPNAAQAKSVHFFGDLTRFGMHVVISDNIIGEQVLDFTPA